MDLEIFDTFGLHSRHIIESHSRDLSIPKVQLHSRHIHESDSWLITFNLRA